MASTLRGRAGSVGVCCWLAIDKEDDGDGLGARLGETSRRQRSLSSAILMHVTRDVDAINGCVTHGGCLLPGGGGLAPGAESPGAQEVRDGVHVGA